MSEMARALGRLHAVSPGQLIGAELAPLPDAIERTTEPSRPAQAETHDVAVRVAQLYRELFPAVSASCGSA